jgi:hypothetical protein
MRSRSFSTTLATTLIVTTAGAVLVLGASSAQAAGATRQGWWTAANPTTPVGTLPAAPPTAPDVPADGLLVEGGSQGPAAVAALLYDLPDGATPGNLTLVLAPTTISTPNAVLQVCPLKSPGFSAVQGGPIASAPVYDCSKGQMVPLAADGTSYVLDVRSDVVLGSVAIALVPAAATDRVVLSKPGPDSLSVLAPSSAAPDPSPVAAGSSTAPASQAPSPSATAAGGGGAPRTGTIATTSGEGAPVVSPPLGGLPDMTTTTAVIPDQVAAPVVADQPVVDALAAGVPDTTSAVVTEPLAPAATHSTDRGGRVIILLMLLALAGLLWSIAGRERMLDEGPGDHDLA